MVHIATYPFDIEPQKSQKSTKVLCVLL